MRVPGRGAACAAVMAGALIAGVGCAAQPPVPDFGTPPARVETAEDIRRPLDAYRPTVEQVVALERAYRGMYNDCLQDNGGTPDAQQNDVRGRIVQRDKFFRRSSPAWGFFDPEAMQRSGYHDTLSHAVGNGSRPDQASVAVMQKCGPETDDKMPMKKAWSQLAAPEGVIGQLPTVAEGDPKLAAAVRRWSECMHKAGYAYNKIDDPYAEFVGNPKEQPQPTERELQAAKTDLACRRSTNFMTDAVAAQWERDKEYIRQHKDVLAQYKKSVAEFLQRHA